MRFLFGGSTPALVDLAGQQVDRCRRKAADLHLQARDAERELAGLRAANIAQAMEMGHLDDLGSAEVASQAASVEILAAAVAKASADLADAEQVLAEAKAAAERERSIAVINANIQDIERDQQAFLSALDNYTNSMQRGAAITLDCQSLFGYLQQIAAELPTASRAALKGLRHKQKQIELGATRPTLPPTPAVQPAPTPVATPVVLNTKTVTLRYGARWVDPRPRPEIWRARLGCRTTTRCCAPSIDSCRYSWPVRTTGTDVWSAFGPGRLLSTVGWY